jgi:long-chain acyl-CoA synthetase
MEERPWLKNYPKGVPANIDPDAYPNLSSLILETFEKYRKKPAFSCMGKTMTFDEINHLSKRFAAYLHFRGLEPGDRIALMMPNLLQYPIVLFGSLRAGLIIVNTNPLYTPHEMLYQFVDSGAKAIVIAENFAANLEKILNDTSIKLVITTSIGEMFGFVKKRLVNFTVRTLKRMVPKYQIANAVTFSETLRQGGKFTIKPFENHPDDTIFIQYTGGTTGVSKGAMLTNRNLVSNMIQVRAFMTMYMEDGKEVALCPLPLYHIFACVVNALAVFSYGGHNILIVNARDLDSVIKALKKNEITIIPAVNTLFNALLHHKDFASLDFSKLKISLGGGMAIQRAVAEMWHNDTGCPLVEGYGLTEASPVVSVNPFDGSGKLGCIGLPIPSTDVRIIDEDGNAQGIDQPGELQVKGPQVMKGYYNRQEETATMIHDGWLHTGDIAQMDNDGYLKIVDRKKDMILVSGFNVYPNEIEDVFVRHPKVLEAAAIGVPDVNTGEAVKVFIVRKDNSVSEEELKKHCATYLTNYKRPKYIEFRKELPKSNVGKILRRELKE